MKRNIESESGSSDEERTSLKKAKKENFGKGEKSESDNTESIDGSKKRITNCNVKIEAPLLKLKNVKGLYIGNTDDQKFIEDKTENDGDHDNGSIKKKIENKSDEGIIREMELMSRKSSITRRYSKDYSNSCTCKTEVEVNLKSICSCKEQTAYVDGNMEQDSVSNNKECMLLADKLTRLFRDIYYTRGKNSEKETISKYQGRRNINGNVKMNVVITGKGESYSSIKEKVCSDEELNYSYSCSETSESYETNDEGLGKEISDYSSDNDIRNERRDASNNSSFREKIARNSTSIGFERRDKNVEKNKNICSAETNDKVLGKDIYYGGVQGDEQVNRNCVGENNGTFKETGDFADWQNNEDSKVYRTSDEESNNTDMEMRNGEEERHSDVNDERGNSDFISDGEVSSTNCRVENSSTECDSTGFGDTSTDEEYSWSDDSKSSSYVDTDGSDKEVSDESSTDRSSDTSSVEDDSTDDWSSKSTDEDDSSNESEDKSDWEMTDESLREDTDTSYSEEIESDVSPLGNDGNSYALFSYRNNKEIVYSSTEEENSFDCANGRSTSETNKDLGDSKNKETTESCSKANDENDSSETKSSDDTDLERSLDNVLGFLSYRRFSIRIPGEDIISVSVTRLKLMPLKDYFKESVDGRRKKSVAAKGKGNIKTPSAGGNIKNGKSEMRGRNVIKNKVKVENKAVEMSDSEELSDEEMERQVKNTRGKKSRNKKSIKKVEPDSDSRDENEDEENYDDERQVKNNRDRMSRTKSIKKVENDSDSRDEDDEDGEDYDDDKAGEDSSDMNGEDNDEELEDEEDEDYGEEDIEDDSEDIEEEEDVDEEDGDVEDADEEQDSEEDEDDGENDEEDSEENEEEEEVEDVNAQGENENDSDEQSSENDKDRLKTKQTKSRIMTKKKETKEQVKGKRNLMKRAK